MRNIPVIFFVASFCLFSNNSKAQISLETFIAKIRSFVTADYSKDDLATLKEWSDSSYDQKDSKRRIRQVWYKGSLTTKEGAGIEFVLTASELTATSEKKTTGNIFIRHRGDCDVLLCPVLGYIAKHQMSFDTVTVANGITCSCDKIFLHFNNYSPSTNKVLENVDTSLIKLIKHEYFDFYFTDLNRQTSKWQNEFKTFMQPYSDALTALVNKGNIKGVFDIINLKNKGYSWFLAEGIWYYNSLHPCLTAEQIKIINSYNGEKELISFRPAEELRKVYKFW